MPGVLESKLFADVGAAQVVERPQLLPTPAMLDGRIRAAVISAPAGYGKSTLLSRWHRHLSAQDIPCAWLTLDADDDDPNRLMRHLIAALQRIDPTLGRSAWEQLTFDDTDAAPVMLDCANGATAALESLAGDLTRHRKRLALFIDDLQCLSSPASLQVVNWLLNYSPARCQYIIGTRTVAPLRLGALRVHGRLLELSTDDLRFSREETLRFIRERVSQTMAPAVAERLQQKVEGWPAALELATIALRSGAECETVIDQFSGGDLNVVDYLGEVVLAQLDQRTRHFLLKISLFDRISAALAAEVTGEQDADARLGAIHRANLFLTPLDRNTEWYRFHPIAADFLRQRYRREYGDPAQVVTRGAHWLYRHGHLESAINAALEVSDWGTAAGWVADSVEALVYQCGYHHTILRWMKQLPQTWVDRYPAIRFHYAVALTHSPFQRESDAQLLQLEQLCERMRLSPQPNQRLIDELARDVALQRVLATGLRDDGPSARSDATAWLARWPDAPLSRRAAAATVQAFGLTLEDDIEPAQEWIATAKDWWHAVEGWYGLAWTLYIEALVMLKAGNYFAARRVAEEGQALLRRHLDGHPRHMAMLHAVLAAVAYEFDEIDRARDHAERCMPRLAESGPCDAVLLGFLTAARLERLARGDSAGVDILREGQELGRRRGLKRVTLSLAVQEYHCHSRAGRLEDAQRVASSFGLVVSDTKTTGIERGMDQAHQASGRCLLRTRPHEALSALAAPIAHALEKGLHHQAAELLLLKTLAHQAAGEVQAALDTLCDVLVIAAPRNYFRLIRDEVDELAPLLERLDPARLRVLGSEPLVQRLRDATRRPLRAADALKSKPAVQLSKREIAILRRLDSGMSNKELSAAIFISEGTLKWHLHNIYGKLDVKNRTGAVNKARSLSLI